MPVRAAAAITLVLLLGYGCVKAIPVLAGPDIRITSPSMHASLPDGFLTIEGRAVHTQTLTLNGAPFLIDEKGHFATTLLLPRGGAILTLTATDRFGRQVSERRTVFVP